jgi:hypothetical protein
METEAGLYKELHTSPPISIKAPKLVSAIAFIIEKEVKKEENQNNQRKQLGKDIISEKEIDDLINDIYTYYNYELPRLEEDIQQKKDTPLYSLFYKQRLIRDESNEIRVVLQNHTSFFRIYFIKEDDEKVHYSWGAIPDGINKNNNFPISEKAVFKTHLRIEKYNQNQDVLTYNTNLKETFNGISAPESCLITDDNIFTELLGSMVSDGKAIIWTPFHPFYDGFNRILVRDISLNPGRLGRLVRRSIEIDLYSTIALRNFADAREQLEKLRDKEKKIETMLSTLSGTTDQSHYNDIADTAKTVAENISKYRYDFQATVAYSDLVWQRINELREQRVEGWARISYFLEKRLRPGVRTCESVLQSQITVSQQIQGVANLLAARLNLQLQKQEHRFNRNIQFLAIFPITYYMSTIIMELVKEHKTNISPDIVVSTVFLTSLFIYIICKAESNSLIFRVKEIVFKKASKIMNMKT